jgi:hypothetical protein
MRIALITNRNKPRVATVTGKVSRIKTGLTNPFKRLSTKAINSAVGSELTDTPGRK